MNIQRKVASHRDEEEHLPKGKNNIRALRLKVILKTILKVPVDVVK
jgi:hypothetical protein